MLEWLKALTGEVRWLAGKKPAGYFIVTHGPKAGPGEGRIISLTVSQEMGGGGLGSREVKALTLAFLASSGGGGVPRSPDSPAGSCF